MSLPEAKKDVSEKPAKNAVTAPTDKQELEADVQRKLKLYGVIQAFRAGRMPDNAQIDETLKWIILPENSPVDVSKLSDDGKTLVDDVRAIIETARKIVQVKNSDELFQNFVAHTSGVQVRNSGGVDLPITTEEAKGHGNQAVKHLRTLLELLITNAETRKLLSDATIIGRDIFATGAAEAASRLRPPAEQLAQVDDAAPPSEWKQDSEGLRNAVDGLAQEVQGTNARSPAAAPAVETSENTNNILQDPKIDASPANAAAVTSANPTVVTTETPSEKKTIKSRLQAIAGRVPEKHKASAKEEMTKTKNYFANQFPKDRREQFIWRLKKVIVECQGHPKYKEALEWFLETVEQYFDHAKVIGSSRNDQGRKIFANDPLLQQSTDELRTLLERFANGAPMQPIFASVTQLWEDSREDEALRDWWKRMDVFARKTLLEPGFILSPQFETQSRSIREDGNKLFEGKYKVHKDALFEAVSTFFKSFSEDPLNKQFGQDWNKLTRDLLFDTTGKKLEYKPQLWKDVRAEILPTLIRKVGYVPIPRAEYTDDKLDLVLENLTLQGRNLFPNIMDININNHIIVSPYSTIKDSHNHTLTITMSQIQADMRDVAFYFRKKTGIKIQDSGLADVFLGGQGIAVTIKLHSQGLDGTRKDMNGRVFKVKKVKVKVDTLKFAIRDSKHDLLYKTVRPLATNLVKKQVSKAIGDGIRAGLEALNDQLVQVRSSMSNSSDDPEFSRTKALKEHFSSKKSQSSETASSVKAKRNSQFKIVPRSDSMILKDVGYDKGWVKRQSEMDDKVADGSGWKSAAFTIVSNDAQV